MTLKITLGVSCMAVFLVAAIPAGSAATPEPGTQAFAQADRPFVTERVQQWTRARLEAAKKRWARNNLKFSACVNELAEIRKTRRVTLHDQGHFLESCMLRPWP